MREEKRWKKKIPEEKRRVEEINHYRDKKEGKYFKES